MLLQPPNIKFRDNTFSDSRIVSCCHDRDVYLDVLYLVTAILVARWQCELDSYVTLWHFFGCSAGVYNDKGGKMGFNSYCIDKTLDLYLSNSLFESRMNMLEMNSKGCGRNPCAMLWSSIQDIPRNNEKNNETVVQKSLLDCCYSCLVFGKH
jgi:hypothetical protein